MTASLAQFHKTQFLVTEVLACIPRNTTTEAATILNSLKKIPTLRLLKKIRSLVDQIAEKLEKNVEGLKLMINYTNLISYFLIKFYSQLQKIIIKT